MNILQHIRAVLDSANIVYREIEHEPTLTSAASALARGEELRLGGKALVLKIAEGYGVFVLSAACKLDSNAIKQYFGVKKLRFATAAELLAMTGLVPGAVPPFGHPILPYNLYVDSSIVQNERIAFNAGSLTHSLVLTIEDYLRVARPTIFHFATAAEKAAREPGSTGEKE
jgi:Ala-tRNA(Pro) deacylase